MKITDIFGKFSKESSKQEYPNLPNSSLLLKANTQSDFSVVSSLSAYENAVTMAKDYERPNRYYLLKYYNKVLETDGHLYNLYNLRINKILGIPFSLTFNGKETPKMIQVYKSNWFRKIMRYSMESLFYGNSLIEILNDKNNNIKVNLFNREHCIPEFELYKELPYDDAKNAIPYNVKPYINNIVDVNANYNHRDLGVLLLLARYGIIKQEATRNWGEFIETYGQPIASATTDTTNPNEINKITNFLKTMGRKKYIVKDSQTSVEYIEASTASSVDFFREFINYINDEMSEIVLSGNMLTSDGSSRSQAEVHERGLLSLTKSDMRFISTIMNNDVIPLLQNKGILPKGNVQFSFDDIEIMSIDEKLKIDQFLIENYNKAPEYFKSRYGVEMNINDNTQDGLQTQ